MQTTFDPEISEWGNPSWWSHDIPKGKQTQRTETSKYLEEEKTIVIPWVVVSEMGTAQTGIVKARPGL